MPPPVTAADDLGRRQRPGLLRTLIGEPVQLVAELRHRCPPVRRRGSPPGRGPTDSRRYGASAVRPRASRAFTVPSGTPVSAAIWATLRSHT